MKANRKALDALSDGVERQDYDTKNDTKGGYEVMKSSRGGSD
jgi:hypothetical protein